MATSRELRTWRHRVCGLLAAMLLVACDLSPLTGSGDAGGQTPVETVTALEVDLEDVRAAPGAQARHDASPAR